MAKRTEGAFAVQRRTGGRHLAPEKTTEARAPSGPEKQSTRQREQSAAGHPAGKGTKGSPNAAKRREGVRRGELPSVRRPARPWQIRKEMQKSGYVDPQTFYRHFVPYIEAAHHRNERSLKAGVWLLVLLPVILVIIQELTNASRIVFLIFWIIGMFGIATALIFTAYSDHDLKKTLEELKELVPPEEEIEIGNLLPVDAEGEGWLIDPEELPIPLPDLSERLPQMGEELRGRISEREAERQKTLDRLREEHLRRLEELQERRGGLRGKQEKQPEGKHLKREKK